MTPTSQQQAAIESDSPLTFVIAGAGSGKTSTIIERIKWLLGSCRTCGGYGYTVEGSTDQPEQVQCKDCFRPRVSPRKIVAITFTNAAAKEIESRLKQHMNIFYTDAYSDVSSKHESIGFCGTLHSFCLKLLRENASVIGYKPGINVLSEDDAEAFLNDVAEKHRFKETMAELTAAVAKGPPVPSSRLSRPALVAAAYYKELKAANLMTFDLILFFGLRVILSGISLPYSHWLIDEVQDSSCLDWSIYSALPGNKFLVGDVDQCIFGFRGARPDLMLQYLLPETPQQIPSSRP